MQPVLESPARFRRVSGEGVPLLKGKISLLSGEMAVIRGYSVRHRLDMHGVMVTHTGLW
jgi:hypothetical protein